MAISFISKFSKKYILLLSFFSICHTQSLDVGDTIPSGFGLPWCANNPTENDSLFLDQFNGAINDGGAYSVIWIMVFTSW